MIELLTAALAASAAAGMRIALPLLVIGLLKSGTWSSIPLLSRLPPPVLIGILTSWSVFELFASKRLLGQRVLQTIQLVCSPIVGAIMGLAVAQVADISVGMAWIIGAVCGLMAFVLQLVQVGWFFRLRGLPLWVVLLQDVLCIVLVIFALDAPKQGGLIALLLLWLAIRSSQQWRWWYRGVKPRKE